jgi:hypothetical protein
MCGVVGDEDLGRKVEREDGGGFRLRKYIVSLLYIHILYPIYSIYGNVHQIFELYPICGYLLFALIFGPQTKNTHGIGSISRAKNPSRDVAHAIPSP